MEANELICFQIISYAGTARAKLMQALQASKSKQDRSVKELLQEADEAFLYAHEVHTKLIQEEAAGQAVQMSLLLCHAEDQLMAAETIKDIVLEFIALYALDRGNETAS